MGKKVQVFVVCVEGPRKGEKVKISNGTTSLGRGALLGIDDKRCSRNQVQMEFDEDNGTVTIASVSIFIFVFHIQSLET